MGILHNIKWVRDNRGVAKVLGITLPKQRRKLRDKLSEINGWRALSDFPKWTKGKGYAAADLIVWGTAFAQRMAPVKARAAAVSEILGSDKPGRRAVKSLENFNQGSSPADGVQSLPTIHGPAATVVGGDDFRAVESIRQLAVRLSAHFKRHITEQRIKDWLAGDLPAGSSPFPLRDPGRNGWNNPRPCFDWALRFYVGPTSENGGVQDDLFARTKREAEMAEMNDTINKERKSRMEAEALEREVSDKWILRVDAAGTSIRAINDIQHIVENEYERGAPQRRREWISGLLDKWIIESGQSNNPTIQQSREAFLGAFHAWDLAEERARIDRIRGVCRGRAAADLTAEPATT